MRLSGVLILSMQWATDWMESSIQDTLLGRHDG